MLIHVDSTAATGAEPDPVKLRLNGVDINVAKIVEHWTGGHERFFNVRDAEDNSYVIKKADNGAWELLMFLSKRGAEVGERVRSVGEPRRGAPSVNGRL